MSTETQTTDTAAVEATTAVTFNLTRTVSFNFKRVRKEELLKTLDENQLNDENFMAQFETITEGEGEKQKVFMKRKSLTGALTLPSFIADIPEDYRETIASIVERELQLFVKGQYIDNYEPIGDHSLETYRRIISTRSSRAAWDYTPEQFDSALASLEKYITKAVNNAQVGKKFSDAAKQRFSRTAITRYLGQFDEKLLTKIQTRLLNWAQFLLDNEPANAEEFSVIFDMWNGALDKHLNAEIVDVSAFL